MPNACTMRNVDEGVLWLHPDVRALLDFCSELAFF
jgi:hypothetical protein